MPPKVINISGDDFIEVIINKGGTPVRSKIKVKELIPNFDQTGDTGDPGTLPPGSYTPVIEEDITSVVSVGGYEVADVIPEGTTLTQFVKDLLAPYLTSAFSSFAVTNDVGTNIIEVGRTITVTQATYTVVNDTEGDPPSNIQIVGPGFDPTTVITSSPHAADDAATEDVTKTSNTTQAWTITGENAEQDVLNRTYTATWRFAHLFGANSTEVTDQTTATAVLPNLQQSELRAGKDRSVTCTADNQNASNYTYIAYAAKFGDLSNVVLDGSTPVLSAFTKVGDFNYTNSYGHTESYRVYISTATGAYQNGQTLTIS